MSKDVSYLYILTTFSCSIELSLSVEHLISKNWMELSLWIILISKLVFPDIMGHRYIYIYNEVLYAGFNYSRAFVDLSRHCVTQIHRPNRIECLHLPNSSCRCVQKLWHCAFLSSFLCIWVSSPSPITIYCKLRKFVFTQLSAHYLSIAILLMSAWRFCLSLFNRIFIHLSNSIVDVHLN